MAREKNFEAYMRRTPPAAYVKAKAEYDKLAKQVSNTSADDPGFKALREKKLDAANAMHAEYQKAEADFFSDEVKEVKEAVKTFREEQAKKNGASAA